MKNLYKSVIIGIVFLMGSCTDFDEENYILIQNNNVSEVDSTSVKDTTLYMSTGDNGNAQVDDDEE